MSTDLSGAQPPCMILDDKELNSVANRIQWRQKGTGSIQDLFHATKRANFPKAFMSERSGRQGQGQGPFPFDKTKKTKPAPKREALPSTDVSGVILSPKYIAEFGVPLLPMPVLTLQTPPELVDEDGDYAYAPMTP